MPKLMILESDYTVPNTPATNRVEQVKLWSHIYFLTGWNPNDDPVIFRHRGVLSLVTRISPSQCPSFLAVCPIGNCASRMQIRRAVTGTPKLVKREVRRVQQEQRWLENRTRVEQPSIP